MKRNVRIGKDFTIRWSIYSKEDGVRHPYDLTGRSLILKIRNAFGTNKVDGFSVSGNILTWAFRGKDQKHTGDYTLILVENDGQDNMVTVDTCEAFTLVAHSCKENIDNSSDIVIDTVELESDILLSPYNYPTPDSELSETSENYVMNKTITAEMKKKADTAAVEAVSKDLAGKATKAEVKKLQDDLAGKVSADDVPVRRGKGNSSVVIRMTDAYLQSDSEADGAFSSALGRNNSSSAEAAHSEGINNSSSGKASHSEGYDNESLKEYSHTEGNSNTADGSSSHAEGRQTKAIGEMSHSEGYQTKAGKNASHAEGVGTVAENNAGEHAEGKYNKSNAGTIHSVGVGSSATDRKNAHEIMSDGKHYVLGIGGYDGTNPGSSKDLANHITELTESVKASGDDVDNIEKLLSTPDTDEDVESVWNEILNS